MKTSIAAVIVTYNRKQLLKRCLDAVSQQTLKPDVVYIVDNASTDRTMESVKEWGYYESFKDSISYHYVLALKNEGGAGGFYLGLKTAYDNGYGGVWAMDDDGVPAPDCLEILSGYLGTYDVISPLVMSITNHDKAAFGEARYKDIIQDAVDDVIINRCNLFNGVLFSRKLIEIVGLPKREMFIWGDEMNYEFRCINLGFHPVTCIKAIHYHPDNRQQKIKTFVGRLISITDVDWKLYYLIRNQTYNSLFVAPGNKIRHLIGTFDNFMFYMYYFTFKSQERKTKIVLRAFLAAFTKDFRSFQEAMHIE